MNGIMKRKLLFLMSILFSISSFGQNYKFKTIDSAYVFDKAKFHLESVESDKLDYTQAFVHTAFYIDWCVDNDLVNNNFKNKFANQILKIRERLISPTELYIEMDGVFLGEILTLEGYNFAMQYFHLSHGKFLKDYERLRPLRKINKSIYGVENTWINYEVVKSMLDKKYERWK